MQIAVAYARYSSDNQRQESIDAQVRAIKEYCCKKQILLTHVYKDEAVSATTDHREGFLQMIEDAKCGGFQLCIVHKLDRFARNRYDSAFYRKSLEKCGVKVVSVLEPLDNSPESVILESVLEGMAEYYSKNLAREVRKGLNENALAAKHNGGIPPLGYDLAPGGGYKINPPEAEAVQVIFDMYSRGYGYSLICEELNRRGLKTKLGRAFGKGSIADILRNEKYIGRYVWNKRLSKKSGNRQYKPDNQITRIDGALPEIISKETWDKVQNVLTSRKRKPRHNQTYYYLLTGKMFCSECGSAYVGSGYEYGRGKKKNYQYSCNGRLRHKCECTNKPIRCEKIEKYVLDTIGEVLSEDTIQSLADKMMDVLNKKTASSGETEKSLELKLDDIKRKIAKTWALYYDGSLPKEAITQQVDILTQQQKDIEKQIINSSIIAERPKILRENVVAYLKKCKTDLESNDPDVLRSLVETFVDRIEISPENIKITIRVSPKANADSDKVGGDDGSRTRVRRQLARAFYERSRWFRIPAAERPETGSVPR